MVAETALATWMKWTVISLKVEQQNILLMHSYSLGGAEASWLVRSTRDRGVRVCVVAVDIILCSWARHLTLTVPLSIQVYKWVPKSLSTGGNPVIDLNPIQGRVEILIVTFYYRNRDKLRPCSFADFAVTLIISIGTDVCVFIVNF